jgi:hypothetical protein
MSLGDYEPGLRRVLQGDFGEAWLGVAAAGCGIDHSPPATTDLIKGDVQLTLREVLADTRNPTVIVQVKTTVGLRDSDDSWAYDLDVDAHELLRQTDHRVRRILAVIGVSADGETLRLEEDGTLLVGKAAWVSLEGQPASPNDAQQVVYLPKTNTLDEPGLRTMLTDYGVSRSTQVPEPNIWDDSTWAGEVRP